MQAIPYLNFDGQCAEAFAFYRDALGGEIVISSTYGESPMAEQCGPDSADHVMHSQVEAAGAILMGADGPPPHAAGSTAINIVPDSIEEAERIFAALAEGGTITMPLAETFWAHRFGALTDRFGKSWMVNHLKPAP